MTVTELQQKVNLKASSNMVLIPQHWSLGHEYSQDRSGIGKLAWKLLDFIKRDGTVKIRRSSRENRSTRKRVRLKLIPQDNIYRDGKVRVETRHLDFKTLYIHIHFEILGGMYKINSLLRLSKTS
ncbi:uncharacterized protein TNCV_4345591 [Trichonephila clavipes]|nr:uncharacterized protein TNCV_4345591 [Trichonephila clavipes]